MVVFGFSIFKDHWFRFRFFQTCLITVNMILFFCSVFLVDIIEQYMYGKSVTMYTIRCTCSLEQSFFVNILYMYVHVTIYAAIAWQCWLDLFIIKPHRISAMLYIILFMIIFYLNKFMYLCCLIIQNIVLNSKVLKIFLQSVPHKYTYCVPQNMQVSIKQINYKCGV